MQNNINEFYFIKFIKKYYERRIFLLIIDININNALFISKIITLVLFS